MTFSHIGGSQPLCKIKFPAFGFELECAKAGKSCWDKINKVANSLWEWIWYDSNQLANRDVKPTRQYASVTFRNESNWKIMFRLFQSAPIESHKCFWAENDACWQSIASLSKSREYVVFQLEFLQIKAEIKTASINVLNKCIKVMKKL